MLNKLISSTILLLFLAQGALSAPQGGPIVLVCGGADDAPCPSDQLCCAKGSINVCQLAGLLCLVPNN
ncbi:hypothetical protein DFH09DRAFT_1375305 [Mycena vulgaris]|nr:hypothetical protein DFH09DRAFT_1375305 [Mycena vulgaris]